MTGELYIEVIDEYYFWAEVPAPVDLAVITVLDSITGQVVATVVAEGGTATITGIPEGIYDIQIDSPQHVTTIVPAVLVFDGQTTDLQPFVHSSDADYDFTVVPTDDPGEYDWSIDGNGSTIEIPDDGFIDLTGATSVEDVAQITGSYRSEEVLGSSFADRIATRGGNDLIYSGPGDDVVKAGTGDDVVETGNGADWVRGGAGDDVIYGQSGADSLRGGDDEDVLHGGGGNDRLGGDAGEDVLVDGAGEDTLSGGTDSDIFVFDTDGASDTVMDYEHGTDLLVIVGQSFDALDITDRGVGEVGVAWGDDRLLLIDPTGQLVAADLSEADFRFDTVFF